MEKYERKSGFTLIEMLVVVTLIMVLMAITLTVATNLDTKAKEQLTRNTIALVDAALQEFEDYRFVYNNTVSDYSGFVFPLDCNNFDITQLQTQIEQATGSTTVVIAPAANHDISYSGCEAMYFFLSRVPQCRELLDRIDDSLITGKDKAGIEMKITVDGIEYPFKRVVDAWGLALRYDYYDENLASSDWKKSRKTFPVVISAGPDKIFDTNDDIRNR